MQYVVLFILLFYLLIFLFCVFVFSKDNFVLLRKNVNTEQMFNITFLVVVVGILIARIFFVAFHYKPVYLNPLVFFLIPYFPGLSIAGGIIGATLFLLAYTYRSKIPTLHAFDIFALSLVCTLPFGIVVSIFYSKMSGVLALIAIICGFIAGSLVYLFHRAKMSDGGVGYISLASSAIVLYVVQLITGKWFVQDDALLLAIFAVSTYFLFRQEQFHKRVKLSLKPKGFGFKLKFKKREKVRWREIH